MPDYTEAIVITGVGAVTAFGLGMSPIWSALESGHRTALTEEETTLSPPPFGLKVKDWRPADLLGKRGLQFLRPGSQFLLGASVLALQDAGFAEQMPDPDELGIVVGCNLAGLQSITNYDYTAVTEGPQYVSPMEAPNTLANAPASHLAIRLKAQALNTTIASGQCAGLDAIGYALKVLREGRARYVVVGGVEELSERVLALYHASGVLPSERVEDAGRPFDSESTGWLPSEGAAVLVLERKADAVARGAHPLAEISAWSSAFAAAQTVEKRVAILKRTAIQALNAGRVTALDIVISGASGLAAQDQVEAGALHDLCIANPNVAITTIKGILGESYSAGGIFQALAAIGMVAHGIIPPTFGLKCLRSDIPPLTSLVTEARTWPNSHRGSILLTSQDLFGSTSAVALRGCG